MNINEVLDARIALAAVYLVSSISKNITGGDGGSASQAGVAGGAGSL